MSAAALLQTAALLGILAVFLGILAWLFRPGGREAADRAAAIPFQAEDRPGTPRRDGA